MSRCYEVSYAVVAEAVKLAGGRPLPPYNKTKMFCAIWGSHIEYRWREIPDVLRGRGAAGAMVGDGRAVNMMETDRIWNGELQVGAVLQVWQHFSDYIRVVNGKKPVGLGHSFVLRNYIRNADNSVAGMKVTDNGYHGNDTVHRGDWGYWVGANLGTTALRLPDPWWTSQEREQIKEMSLQEMD